MIGGRPHLFDMTNHRQSIRTLRATRIAGLMAVAAGCAGGSPADVVTQKSGAALSAAPSPSKGSGLVWHLPSGEVQIWDMANGTDAKAFSVGQSADPAVWKIVAAGDFNGDGGGDLLWTDARDGLLDEWRLWDTRFVSSTVPTNNAPVSTTTVDGVSTPFATSAYAADEDGDGITDVLWRELSISIDAGPYGAPRITTDNIHTEEWLLNSSQTTPKYWATMDSPTSSVAAAADFDGDSRGDILFHDSSSGETWAGLASGYSVDYSTVPVEWSIMGSGDFNGDGTDDILWYDTIDGWVAIWFLHPGTGVIDWGPWFQNVPANSGWTIDGVGDTNHDGISDIIWEHSSGVISVWTMNADATVADYGATLAKPAGATFAGVVPLGPPPPVLDLRAINEQLNGTEVDALIEFLGQAARPNDSVEIWTAPNGAKLATVPTFQVQGSTLGAWVNTALLPGGAQGCFAIRAWEQGRTSTAWSNTVCLPGFPSPLQGHVDFVNQSDNNRCVPDPAHVLSRMNPNGGLMAWHYAKEGYTALDGQTFHTETIVRMPYLPGTSLDGSIFASNFSHPKCDNPSTNPNTGDCGAHLGIAKLGYTGGRAGRMLGTNRGFYGSGPYTSDWTVAPTPEDPQNAANRGDTFMPIGSPPSPHFNMSPADNEENHPGGASALGQYLVTGLQAFQAGCTDFGLKSCNPVGSEGIVQIWDLADPLNPVKRSSFTTYEDPSAVNSVGQGKDAVSVAMTKLNNGQFLMAMITDTPTQRMEFYLSRYTTLDDPHPFGDDWRGPNATWPVGTPLSAMDMRVKVPEWQSFSFLTGCDGSLWAIGMRDEGNANRYPGPDSVDLYRLTITMNGSCGSPYCVTMTPAATAMANDPGVLSTRSMNCSDNNGGLQCSFAAGAGTYVDPDGNVILYGTNYDGDGGIGYRSNGLGGTVPYPTDYDVHGNGVAGVVSEYYAKKTGYIRGKEFHERHGSGGANTACPTLDSAWVEFYSQANFNNGNPGDNSGQIFYQDYSTQSLRNPDFGANSFAQKAQSVRWCLPPGSAYKISNASNASTYLRGSGAVVGIAALSSVVYTNNVGANQSIRYGAFVDSDSGTGYSGTPDSSK